ncbi:MAG TPA: hypothetical protein VIF62_27820, partial [Labilithrix sp.]
MSNVLAKAAIVALLTLAACSGSESERSPVLSDPGASTMSAKTVDEVQISAVADAASVTAGDPIGYVITVADTGKGTGKKLVLTDTLPTNAGLAWSISPENSACTIASNVLDCSVTLGKSSSFSVHVVSPTTQSSCGTVSDQASVVAKNGPSTTSNTAVIAIGCPLHGTSLSVPSSGGDTNVKVADVSTLGTTVAAATNAGDTNIKVTSTAPFYGTTLAAPSSGGDTDIKVLSTADLQPGETLHIDSESAIVAAVGSSGLTGTGVT